MTERVWLPQPCAVQGTGSAIDAAQRAPGGAPQSLEPACRREYDSPLVPSPEYRCRRGPFGSRFGADEFATTATVVRLPAYAEWQKLSTTVT